MDCLSLSLNWALFCTVLNCHQTASWLTPAAIFTIGLPGCCGDLLRERGAASQLVSLSDLETAAVDLVECIGLLTAPADVPIVSCGERVCCSSHPSCFRCVASWADEKLWRQHSFAGTDAFTRFRCAAQMSDCCWTIQYCSNTAD